MSIRIDVLGGGGEVGRVGLSIKNLRTGTTILLDYGVKFDEQDRPVFPQHVRPKDINAVILSHAHLDHCGALPSLYISHNVPLYTTPLTIELSELLIKDFLKLSGYYLPFEYEEINRVRENTYPVTYGEEVSVNEVSISFINAGHVPGSMMSLIDIDGYRILFTGDFNTIDTNLLRGADLGEVGSKVDLIIMEGTYVNGTHPSRVEVEKEFVGIIEDTLSSGGSVLIPSFAVGRAQEIMLTLIKYKLNDYPIVIDGLARVANEIIQKYPQYLRDYNLYRRAIEYCIDVPSDYFRRNIVKEPCIIIAPAGMLKGGAVLFYLKKLGRSRKNAIIMPSFQVPGTPGFSLLTKGRVWLGGEFIVEAKVYWLDFSAHLDKKEIIKFIKRFGPDTKILMIHTEKLSAYRFSEKARELYGIDNIHVPDNEETIII